MAAVGGSDTEVEVTEADITQAAQLKEVLGELISCRSVADNRLRIEVRDSSLLDSGALEALGVETLLVFDNQLVHLLFAGNTVRLAVALSK
jgi:PTS system glucose-specific IIC component